MSLFIGRILTIIWGLAAGTVIGTAIVSFISILGVIPRMLSECKIRSHYLAAGTAVSLGSIVGTIFYNCKIYFPLPSWMIGIFGLAYGMFIGCLAVALAEVLDVLPIMKRRLGIKKGVHWLIFAFAIGKLVGALYYWLYPGFLSVINC